MCGIVAFFSKNPLAKHRREITALLQAANARGGHSFGFTLYDSEYRPIGVYRVIGKGVAYTDAMAKAHGILYHARYATSAPILPDFTQPVRLLEGYGAHNGHVSVDEKPYLSEHDPRFELDSAHLLSAIEDRNAAWIGETSGYGATVYIPDGGKWIEVWSDGQTIFTAKTRKSLIVSSVPVKDLGVKWSAAPDDGDYTFGDLDSGWYRGDRAMPLAESWGSYRSFRALTNRGDMWEDDADDFDLAGPRPLTIDKDEIAEWIDALEEKAEKEAAEKAVANEP